MKQLIQLLKQLYPNWRRADLRELAAYIGRPDTIQDAKDSIRRHWQVNQSFRTFLKRQDIRHGNK